MKKSNLKKITFRIGVIIVVFISGIFFIKRYQSIKAKEAYDLQIQKNNEEIQRLAEEKKEQQRKDSVNFYLEAALKLEKILKPVKALGKLDNALKFLPDADELTAINKIKNDIYFQKSLSLIKKGNYKAALPELDSCLLTDVTNNDFLYYRAICYSKTGRIQAAVNELKGLVQNGNLQAAKFYNKINPIRRKIIGYITRCCDGSTSYARGRGACSWHGGVCNWNAPIYEESRKY